MAIIKQKYIKMCIAGLFMILSIVVFLLQDNSAIIYISILQVILACAYLINEKISLIEILFIGFLLFFLIFTQSLLCKLFIYDNIAPVKVVIENTIDSLSWVEILSGLLFWTFILTVIIEAIFKKKISINFFKLSSSSFKKIAYYFVCSFIVIIIISTQFLAANIYSGSLAWGVILYLVTLIVSIILFVVTYKVQKRFSIPAKN
ncbi:hypothetical protein MYMA111404_02995 [Mycoplasma marinum]|uniref:Uncharacterized protein n=1 Tax=Mycoplasma marinum TaxID=1937190 RepID=A0A4R0XLD0_9MOLU|nr:hypothetical protein [Mycoplasma marinum]TCG11274.1 hypothetical protein C4B24_02405 [Mycoplasma marinum]